MNRTAHEIEPEEVMAYLDGELEPSRAIEVAAHIAACKECATVEADLRALPQKLALWTVEPSTIALETVIRAEKSPLQVRKDKSGGAGLLARRKWTGPMLWRFAAVGAAVVLAVALETPRLLRIGGSRAEPQRLASSQPTVPVTNTEMSPDVLTLQKLQAQEQLSESLEKDAAPDSTIPAGSRAPAPGPMIARTASMNLVIAKLDVARASLEKLLARHHAFASEMTLDQSNDASASLNATLQVPSAELDATLSDLRALGRVSTESQGGEDVSDQHVDLAARLHNARESEERLLDILRTRTGKVTDVLAVEEQISQTRGEIEQMEAQLANLDKRVTYASIKLQMAEEYKAPAGANGSVALRLRNAIVSGYRDALDSLLALAVLLLSAGPTLLIWAFILFWPARAIWKRRGALRAAFGKG